MASRRGAAGDSVSSVKESGGYIAIIAGLKQTEAADVGLVQRIVIRVIAGHDSTEDFAVFPREE